MLFKFTNALVLIQQKINIILALFLDMFVIVYLDDIFIYFANEEEHIRHVREIIQVL